jgi:methyl-accepting chemotaxis protein
MANIQKQTDENSQRVDRALEVAGDVQGAAGTGDEQMKQMVTATGEIDAAAQDIARVIKVIDDIAFQINLLSLNAAVEAARAGEHGRGFGVVAEEVKLLARQSALAAEEITSHVHGITQATEDAARSMAETHQGMVEMHQIVGRIAAAVTEQRGLAEGVTTYVEDAATSVDEIGQGISRTGEKLAAAIEQARGGVGTGTS